MSTTFTTKSKDILVEGMKVRTKAGRDKAKFHDKIGIIRKVATPVH